MRAILFIFRSSSIITREIIFFVCAKPQTKVTRLSTKGQHQQLVETLSEWIEQNLDKRIVIDDIAKRAGYSKWYLQRLFKEVTGDNLASYVRHRRLMRAAAELNALGLHRGYSDRLHPPCMRIKMSDNSYRIKKFILISPHVYQSEYLLERGETPSSLLFMIQ